jgi:hypothetical protein
VVEWFRVEFKVVEIKKRKSLPLQAGFLSADDIYIDLAELQ